MWEYNGVEFRRGDHVRVVRLEENFASNGMGEGYEWQNQWVKNMDGAIGFEFEIHDIDGNGVTFTTYVDASKPYRELTHFKYPLSVLEKVEYVH